MNPLDCSATKASFCLRWLYSAFLTLALLGTTQITYGQYCTAEGTNMTDEHITNVTFADLTNSSGQGTYTYYTNVSANVIPGATYPVSVSMSQSGTFLEHATVYIDWNQNEVFDPSEVYYLGSCNSSCTFTGNITVPTAALPGVTRMRVIQRYSTAPATNGCGTFSFGEVEDYNVNVIAAACPPPLNVSVSNNAGTSADISFTDALGDVYIEYGIAPFTPGDDENAGGGTVIGPVSSPANIAGLVPGGTTYTVYIRQDCGSEWSLNSSITFQTACTYTAPYFESFENLGTTTNATWPLANCIMASPTNTTSAFRWDRLSGQPSSGTTTGPSSAYDGSIFAFTESSSGVTNALATIDLGPIDVSPLDNPALSFFYHMHGETMGTLNTYVSSDGVTWDLVDTKSGAQQTSHNDLWMEELINLSAYANQTISIRFAGVRGTSFTSDMAIDAVRVDELPSCFPPTDIELAGMSQSSADVTWTCEDCTGDFYIEYGAPGFTPGSGATAGDGTVQGPFSGTSGTITGLTFGETYTFYIRQDCGEDGYSYNSASTTFFLGICNSGGPTSTFDSNVQSVSVTGLNSNFSHSGCNGTVGPLGVQNMTSLSANVAEGLSNQSVQVTYGSCSSSCYGGSGSVWVDWNNNMILEPEELIGSNNWIFDECPITDSYSINVPAGTAVGPKTMRVMQWEGGQLPLDPCGSFSWGSVMDFTLEVVPAPECTVVDAEFTLLSNCPAGEFNIQVEVLNAGDSPDGLVDITNNGGAAALNGVGAGTYIVGPFNAGTTVTIVVEHLGDVLCGTQSTAMGTNCVVCAAGPTSTSFSNVELVEANGFGGSGFSFTGCPGSTGVVNQTALSVDVPAGFSYPLTVTYGSCGGYYDGAGSVWVDWNGDYEFTPDELVGDDVLMGASLPAAITYMITPPPGTPEGPKRMRVMQVEFGVLPLNPCATFTWGSVMDFTVNVVPEPDCNIVDAEFTLLANCPAGEFNIQVEVLDAGDSPDGLVDITNNGGAAALNGVGAGTYIVGPFNAGTTVTIVVEHLGDAVCSTQSAPMGTNCVACAAGPSTTSDSNVELVEANGFGGSGFSFTGCPAFTGVVNQTALSVDVPAGFSYPLTVTYGSCSNNYYNGAGSVWVDWNGDYEFTPDELVGDDVLMGGSMPSAITYTITPPPGTPEGPKRMRVMQFEGGALPLNPCATFTWGSVMDFTVNVVANPGCMPATVSLSLGEGSCETLDGLFYVDVDVSDIGDASDVTITNSEDSDTFANVGTGIYTFGPFASGTDIDVHVTSGVAICDVVKSFSYNCPPPNDNCEDVTPITLVSGVPEVINGNSEGATHDNTFTGGTMVWEAFTVTGTCNNVIIDLCGNAILSSYQSVAPTCPANAASLIIHDLVDWNLCGDGSPTYMFNGLDAGTYYFPVLAAIDGGADYSGPYVITITSTDCPTPPTDECMAGFTASPGSFISNSTPTVSTINVGPQSGGSYITDLKVAVNITHTWVSDMSITLTSPCGTTVSLFNQSCGSASNLHAMFDDNAGLPIGTWCASRLGPVIPEESLAIFNDELVEGNWTLTVTDHFGGDNGTLVQWCIIPTLDNVCIPAVTEVTAYTNESITLDLLGSTNSCFNLSNYESFDITWPGGSVSGVDLPYTITGLDAGTQYLFDVYANCTGGVTSSSSGVIGTTLNCAPEDVCAYELTLSNTSGEGWGEAVIRVNNGWSSTDYTLDANLQTQSWTIAACPGSPISLQMMNNGNGGISSNHQVTLTNSDQVIVFSDAGPAESILYSQSNACPDCSPVNDIQATRLAADLVELSWNNIELPENVEEIQVIVLIEDFFGSIEIANETFPAGTSSASVQLDGSYPFSDITVQVVTACSESGGVVFEQTQFMLPGCDAAEQCAYEVNMGSTAGTWGDFSLTATIDGMIDIDIHLSGASSGTQIIYTCSFGDISFSAEGSEGAYTGPACFGSPEGQWPSGTYNVPNCNGTTYNITTNGWPSEYSLVNVIEGNIYTFGSNVATDFITIADANATTALAAGNGSVEWTASFSGVIRFIHHLNDLCETQASGFRSRTVSCVQGGAVCSTNTFSVVLNPATDNVTLVAETDFCNFNDGEIVYSGATCPSCFPSVSVTASNVTHLSATIGWTSNNPAGTDYTVYVGLPGFTPGVDEVVSISGVTTASGPQTPVFIDGLDDNTTYHAVVVEHCIEESADAAPVSFTTQIGGISCATASVLSLQPGGGCPLGSTTNSFAGMVSSGLDISCIDFVMPDYKDAWYTFNSGSYDYITLYVELELAAFVVVDIYEGCGGEAIFCENGYASPQHIAVTPNTDYIVRITTAASNNGNHSICVSPPSGCTDENALNHDPLAQFDDGSCYSCEDAHVLTVNAGGGCPANQEMFTTIGSDNDLGNYVSCLGATVPFVDEFFTFNSGSSTGVEIALTLGTMGSAYIELFKECSGEVLYCANFTSNTVFGPFGVEPNTDYAFRISTSQGATGTFGVCVQEALPPPGCTDPTAINYDPLAGIDDGSCLFCGPEENGIVLSMEDSFGDGWNGGTYTITSFVDPFTPVVIATGDISSAAHTLTGPSGVFYGEDYFCWEDGCYEIFVSGGSWPTEISWSISGVDGGSVSGGANTTVPFTINGVCEVLGCNNPNAINFDPNATLDDGSCQLPDCTDPPEVFTYCYGNFEDTSFEISPLTPGGQVILYFLQGTIESYTWDKFTIYDGANTSAPILFQNPTSLSQMTDIVVESTLGNGLFITFTSDGSNSCQTTSSYNEIIADIYCGMLTVYGCTNPEAMNYDPAANVDDASCIFSPVNDDCASATALNPMKYPAVSNVLGTIVGALTDGTSACAGTNGPDVYYTFNVPSANHYWVNLNPFGGFFGVVEVLDACDGTVVACGWSDDLSGPFCDSPHSGTGFPSLPACESAICAADSWCCNIEWDGACASATLFQDACATCTSVAPAGSGPVSLFIEDLPAGDYVVRVRDYYGYSYTSATGNFLLNVQYFPTAKVQDNPNNFLYACNQTGFQLEDFVGATPQSGQGALDYQWLIAEQGATENWTWTRGGPNYSTRIEWLGMDYGKTYNVYVRILLDVPGHGEVWGVFQIDDEDPNAIGAAECTISTSSNVTPTEVRPNFTPTNTSNQPYSLCDLVTAYNVSGSENFRWRFDPDTDPNNANEIYYTRGTGNPSVRLNWVNGLVPGTVYNVAVEVRVLGEWSGFSTVLPVELALPPNNLAMRAQFCGLSFPYPATGNMLSETVCEADFYSFQLLNLDLGTVHTRNSANYVLPLQHVTPALTPGEYEVRVRVTQSGIPGDFGPPCTITIGDSEGMDTESISGLRNMEELGSATLYPNPNAGNEVRVEMSGLGDGSHEVYMVMFDIYGKQVSSDEFGHEGDQLFRLIRFNEQLAMGVYTVQVYVDGKPFAIERLVVK